MLTLISDHNDPYKFCFYCPATHVMYEVLLPKSVNKWYIGDDQIYNVVVTSLILKSPITSFSELVSE